MEEEFLSKKRTLEDDSDTINFERAQRNQWQKHKKAKLNELMQNSSNPIVNEYKEKKRKETKEFRRGPGVQFTKEAKQAQWIGPSREKMENQKELIRRKAAQATATTHMLMPQEDKGFLVAEGNERTCDVTQDQLMELTDYQTNDSIFNLELDDTYVQQYSRNGVFSLLGGSKGNFALFNWKNNQLLTERNVQDNIHDVSILHNQQLFALAQSHYVYIYDSKGIEQHKLRSHINPRCLEYLPYHFLLTSVGLNGILTYHDISIGEKAAQLKTGTGDCFVMKANQTNAIMHLGTTGGQVQLFSPLVNKPLVSMLCHKGNVVDLAINREGLLMATAGIDNIVRVYDLRTYREVSAFKYFQKVGGLNSLAFSQTGLLAVGYGKSVDIRKDCTLKQSINDPYMFHQSKAIVKSLDFCPYEDVLGIGHGWGFQSLVIPGAGDPNFDSFVENPFQTKNQRREQTVKNLLQKIPIDMITLDTSQFASLRPDLNDSSYVYPKGPMQKRLEAREKAKEARLAETSEQRKAQSDAAKLKNLIKKGDRGALSVEPNTLIRNNKKNYINQQPESDENGSSYILDNIQQELPKKEKTMKIKKVKGLKKVSAHEQHRQNKGKKDEKRPIKASRPKSKESTGSDSKESASSSSVSVQALDRFKKTKS